MAVGPILSAPESASPFIRLPCSKVQRVEEIILPSFTSRKTQFQQNKTKGTDQIQHLKNQPKAKKLTIKPKK